MLTDKELLEGMLEIQRDAHDLRLQYGNEPRELLVWSGNRPATAPGATEVGRFLQWLASNTTYRHIGATGSVPSEKLPPLHFQFVSSDKRAAERAVQFLRDTGKRIPEEWRKDFEPFQNPSPEIMSLIFLLSWLNQHHPTFIDKHAGYGRIKFPLLAIERVLETRIDGLRQIILANQRAQQLVAPPQPGLRVKRVAREDRNAVARTFLSKHPTATIRILANHLGCSTSTAAELGAWKAHAKLKQANSPARKRVIGLGEGLLQTVAAKPELETNDDETVKAAELQRLIEEQKADDEASSLASKAKPHRVRKEL